MNTLAELYRREKGIRWLSEAIRFPALIAARSASALNIENTSGIIYWSDRHKAERWVSAKVRLGRVLKEVVASRADLFREEGSSRDRMHAFEASLFVVGYDPACLKENFA